MDSDPESSECPLCLEVLEADDLNFYPCTCCYQICRFCWHRIRTDENGLCPACRKPYSENPAQFKPLTDEEIQQVKRERKLKESNKKPKVTESRKHLTNLRVVQRNLVFVNGLPSRLADTELLRRNDHFGKYGKIVKLVTSPAHNGQLNSICVYITYSRSEEALRAIQALSNYQVDGRTLKATLGTTKYCSRYLKGASCQKTDCLYLHEPGDPLASFTKEQMQQGLHLDYEKKLMEQYSNKHASAQSTSTPATGRTLANGHQNESSQRRKHPNQPTPLLPPSNATMPVNGHSDLESGDETHHQHHHTSNEYSSEPFTSTTAINVDSDSTSTSSHTSSEHDPQVASSASTNPTQAYHVSPNTNWPEERTSFFSANNLASSQSNTNKPVSPPMNTPVSTLHYSPPNTASSHPLPDSTYHASATNNHHHNNDNQHHHHHHHTVKPFDQVPEYKLFSSNTPSLRTILFGNNENHQSNSALSHRPLLNGADHDVRVIEKRLMESSLSNGNASSLFLPTQEQDELGFDPCSLFMSALAPDIEDERRPSSSMGSSRLFSNAYANHPSHHPPTMNPSQGQINPAWFTQQQQQQQYSHYQEPHATLHKNGAAPQKPQPLPPHQQQQQQQQQQRYPPPYNGSSTRQMWNGHQPPQQQQYTPQLPSRLDYNNQMQPQRLPTRQASPSPQYPHSINNNHTHHPNKNTYSSNNTVTANNSNDGWMNLHSIDPAIISFGNKVDTSASQWSSTTQSQGTSALPSGNNLISTSRWSQSQSQPIQFPTHMMSNGIYAPYSTASGVDDGNRS